MIEHETDLETMAAQLGDALRSRGLMVSTAESCTGGWVAKVLTDRAGSSDYMHSGLVTYSNDAKARILGVSEQVLESEGAVSEAVVEAMVSGACALTGADVAVAISGVAGPGGGSPEKPVGTVWFAWGGPDMGIETACHHFEGKREEVRHSAVGFALSALESYVRK